MDIGPPSTLSTAPSVGSFAIAATPAGATITWTGTLQATWNGASNEGYALFLQAADGTWQLLQPEVEPPLTVIGLQQGQRVGIAPVYLSATGQPLVAGQVESAVVTQSFVLVSGAPSPTTEYYYTPTNTGSPGLSFAKTYDPGVFTFAGQIAGGITGTVTDAATGQAIADATVTCPNGSQTTDGQGYFICGDVPAGTASLTTSAAGFQGGSLSVAVTKGQTATADLQLAPASSPLQATALSFPNASGALDGGAELQASLTAAGSGLAGQTVAFAVYGGASLGSATTDGSGQADLLANLQGLSAGTYTITASFAGSSQYQASQATASLMVTTPTANFMRVLQPGWNALTIPFATSVVDLERALSSGARSVAAAYAFTNGEWRGLNVNRPWPASAAGGAGYAVPPMTGLFIYIEGDSPVTATFALVLGSARPSVSLTAGWNLVGPSASGGAEGLSAWLAGNASTSVSKFVDPRTGVALGDPGSVEDREVLNGHAYWLYATAAASLDGQAQADPATP